jgi:hypothetical protein
MVGVIRNKMKTNQTDYCSATQDVTGLDFTDPKDLELANQINSENFSNPKAKEIAQNMGIKAVQEKAKDINFIFRAIRYQNKTNKLIREIQAEDTPIKHTAVGAGIGASGIIVPVMLYVIVKKLRTSFSGMANVPKEVTMEPSEEIEEIKEQVADARSRRTKTYVEQSKETEFDSNVDSIARILESCGIEDNESRKIASIISAFLSKKEAKLASVSQKKLLGILLSKNGLSEIMEKAGVETDIMQTLKEENALLQPTNGSVTEYCEINLPPELYMTPGPWQDLATLNPRGKKSSEFRRIIEGHGFDLQGGSNSGHLFVYYKGKQVYTSDNRPVCIVAHGDSIGKSHVRAIGKRLAFFLWEKRETGN